MLSGDVRLHPAAPASGRSQPISASLASGMFRLFSLCTEKNAYNRAWQLKWVIANISVFISEAKQVWEGVCPM